MPQGAGGAFAADGTQERDDLLRLAVLLTDDRADAARLARTGLIAAGRRSSSDGDPAATAPDVTARDVMVRRALAPRPWDGRRNDSWVASEPPGLSREADDALRAALAQLPPPTRAAVVLACWAGVPDEEIGAVLRTPVAAVPAMVADGTAALRSALPATAAFRRPGEPTGPAETDGDLREALDELARTAASTLDVPTSDELWRDARRRRGWWSAAVAGCVVVLAAVLVAVLVLEAAPTGNPRPAADRTGSTTVSTALPPPLDLAALPPRGSLADDPAYLAALRELPWTDRTSTDFPFDLTTVPESRRVLFAGDVPGARWALLVARPEVVEPDGQEPGPVFTDDLYFAWFVGPPGAEPEQMTLGSYPYAIFPEYVPALLDPRTGTLVVVAAPGDSVEVSPGVEIDADGVDSRAWTTVDTVDGVAVARVDPVDLPWTWSVLFRVLRDGREVLSSTPDGMIVSADEQVPDLGIAYATTAMEEGRLAAQYAVLAVLSSIGLSSDDVDITVQALVPVPAPALGTIALVTLTLPSGAVVRTAHWARDTPEGVGGADCGLEVGPAGLQPEESVLVARCELYDSTDGRPVAAVLLVTAPPRVALVRFYRGDSSYLGEHAMPEGGVLLVPAPDGVSDVEGVSEDGVLLGRTEPLGHWAPTD